MKRIYLADYEGAEFCYAFVADNIKEAKKMAFNHDEFCDISWIEVNIKWRKSIDAKDMTYGEVSGIDGIKCGVYSWYEDGLCKGCDCQTRVMWDENLKEPRCSGCITM